MNPSSIEFYLGFVAGTVAMGCIYLAIELYIIYRNRRS